MQYLVRCVVTLVFMVLTRLLKVLGLGSSLSMCISTPWGAIEGTEGASVMAIGWMGAALVGGAVTRGCAQP